MSILSSVDSINKLSSVEVNDEIARCKAVIEKYISSLEGDQQLNLCSECHKSKGYNVVHISFELSDAGRCCNRSYSLSGIERFFLVFSSGYLGI